MPALLCPLQNHFPLPAWGSGLFGFCLQMWPALHTQWVKSTLRPQCEPRGPCPWGARSAPQHRKHRGLSPNGRCGRRNSTPSAAELLGAGSFPSVQMEKLSPGRKSQRYSTSWQLYFPCHIGKVLTERDAFTCIAPMSAFSARKMAGCSQEGPVLCPGIPPFVYPRPLFLRSGVLSAPHIFGGIILSLFALLAG